MWELTRTRLQPVCDFGHRSFFACLTLTVGMLMNNGFALAQDGLPYPLRSPVRMAITPERHVAVADQQLQKILMLDENTLELLGAFPVAGIPSGLACGNGFYYVGNETAKRVEVYAPNGEKQYNLGGDYMIEQPNDISVDSKNGQVFVVDTREKCVRVFGANGAYLRSFPAGSAAPNLLANPTSIALDEGRREVLVSDFGAAELNIGARVQIFGYDGAYHATIAGSDIDQGARFSRPQGLAVDGQGHVFLVDGLSGKLLVLNRDTGARVQDYGAFGSDPGQLLLPLDLVIDAASGNILVTNNRAQRVEVFKGAAGQVVLPLAGDVDLSGSVTAVDVQLVINKALGLDVAGQCDIDSSGNTDAVDVQLVINAALGMGGAGKNSNPRPLQLTGPAHDGLSLAKAQESVHECTYCHGVWEPAGQTLLHDPVVEVLCLTCHGPAGISILKADVHTNHVGSSHTFRMTCTECHVTYGNQLNWHGGTNITLMRPEIDTPNSGPRKVAFESRGSDAGSASLHSFADNDEDADGVYDGICEVCHTQTVNHRNDSAGNHDHSTGANCTTCHSHTNSFLAAACDSCHGAPPATGAHLKHFGGIAALASYGGTQNLSTKTDYIFQCGSCHPMSGGSHRNGVVDVELYNASAPAGSLKSKNPPSASYTPGLTVLTDANGISYSLGSCSNVYCHSKTEWSSPNPISSPLINSGTGQYIRDVNGNLSYAPYTVTQSTVYVSVGWGDAPLTCNGCHKNGPQTAAPAVQAGVGDSHSWIDNYGYDNLHAWNMGFAPLMCRTCHYSTVTASMTSTRDAMGVATYGDVALADKANHVNGTKDVAFDTVDSVVYKSTFSLASASYNPAERTCSSVPCHIKQTTPQWGLPYRWDTNECDYCHQYSGLFPPSVKKAARGPAKGNAFHVDQVSQECRTCHLEHR